MAVAGIMVAARASTMAVAGIIVVARANIVVAASGSTTIRNMARTMATTKTGTIATGAIRTTTAVASGVNSRHCSWPGAAPHQGFAWQRNVVMSLIKQPVWVTAWCPFHGARHLALAAAIAVPLCFTGAIGIGMATEFMRAVLMLQVLGVAMAKSAQHPVSGSPLLPTARCTAANKSPDANPRHIRRSNGSGQRQAPF